MMETTTYLSNVAAGKPGMAKSTMTLGTRKLKKQTQQPWVCRARSYSSVVFWLLSMFIWSGMVGKASALEVAFCTEQNTGEKYPEQTSIFQSHGLCADQCRAKYAFAVVLGVQCWCTDYAPDKSAAVSKSKCNSKCPGYNQEDCGSIVNSLYGYIRLGKAPTGTKLLSTSTTFTSSKTTKTSSGSSSTNTASKTSSAVTSTVTTSDGRVTTVTALPTGNQSVLPNAAQSSSGSFFSHTGKVVGLFVGLAILIGFLVLGLLFLLHRRKQKRGMHLTGGSSTPEPGMAGTDSAGKGRIFGLFTPGLSEKNGESSAPPFGSAARTSGNGVIAVDQRLEPNVLRHSRMESDNVSRMSIRSLRDDTDYSRRVLRVTNAD